jgi:murein L,D-transpeptidase YafK
MNHSENLIRNIICATLLIFSFTSQAAENAQYCAKDPKVSEKSLILIHKKARTLSYWQDSKRLYTTKVALGFAPTGHKIQQGDGRTPEGRYRVNFKHPGSRFYLALKISYPDAKDRKTAREKGVSPGGDIMIHGPPGGQNDGTASDWTLGCIALSRHDIRRLYEAASTDTVVEICP